MDGAVVVDRVMDIPLPGRTIGTQQAAGEPVALPSFVAGAENSLVATAIDRLLFHEHATDRHDQDVATQGPLPAQLTIYGPSGTGKTHLARGLVRCWQSRFDHSEAEYFTATDFRYALLEAVRNEAMGQFRRRVRHCRLLVLEDLQRLPGDRFVQQELRYTIDALEEHGGVLVVTSLRPIGGLRNLAADVQSRLTAGLAVPIHPPNAASRERLIQQASALLGPPLSAAAAQRLAHGAAATPNDLFGALLDLYADHRDRNNDDLRWVERYLAAQTPRRPTMRMILQTVARHYSVTQKVLKSSSRRQSVVAARAMAIYLARELAHLSYERIGQSLGGRDHTTIMHNYRKIADQRERDLPTRDAVEQFYALLKT